MPGSWSCYNEDGRSPLLAANTGPELPSGVARAFLCGDGLEGFGTAGPLDPLVLNPDRIVELFHAAPAPAKTEGCGYEASSQYRVVLRYNNGDTWVLTGYEEDCQPITDGTTSKAGAGIRQKIIDMWLEQRALANQNDATAATKALTCNPAQYSMIPLKVADATGAVACGQLDIANPESPVVLDPALVAKIAAAAPAEAVPGQPDSTGPNVETGTILLTNAWGDIHPLTRWGNQYQFTGDTEMMVWTPSAELAAEMDRAFG